MICCALELPLSLVNFQNQDVLAIAFHTKCTDLNSFPLSQINYHENKRMVSCVFNLKYCSQNLVKLHMFLKYQDQQISNLSLILKINQDLWE